MGGRAFLAGSGTLFNTVLNVPSDIVMLRIPDLEKVKSGRARPKIDVFRGLEYLRFFGREFLQLQNVPGNSS